MEDNLKTGRFSRFSQLHMIAKRLILIRGLRSLGQGAMVVDLALYLKDLHWSGAAIGGVTSAAGLFGALLILFVGVLSDKFGRRMFLLVYEALTLTSAVLACFTSAGLFLVLAIVIAGFGRGQSGAAGPFMPAEQAWLARHVNRSSRGFVFSLNNAVGFGGMAIGAMFAGIPTLLRHASPLVAYRPVFLLVALVSLICVFILLRMQEEPQSLQGQPPKASSASGTGGSSEQDNQAAGNDADIRKQENRSMMKLAFVNVLNGLAVGLTGPMMAYWFSVRYGVSTAAIGATLAIGFLMTGVSSVLNGFLAERVGMVKSVTWMRVIGSAMMIAMPFIPHFTVASILYIVRGAINRGTQGNRAALSASLTRDARRGLAVSINAFSMRVPSSIGPTISGYLFDVGQLGLPLFLTAGLQLANAGLYQWLFGSYDRGGSTESKKAG